MSSSTRPGPSAVAAHLRRAVERADWQSLAEVLHPNVSWGSLEGGGNGCRGRSHVLGRCARLHADGLRVTVDETFTYPAAVVLGLRTSAEPPPGPETTVYQVYEAVGRIAEPVGGRVRATAMPSRLACRWRW